MSKKSEEKTVSGKRRRKVLRVFLVLLLIVLIAAVIVGFKFRSHIKAAIIWLTASDEDIQNNIDKAKEQQTEVLNNSGFNASKELQEALEAGRITAEEHTQILVGSLTLEEVLASKEESIPEAPDEEVNNDSPEKDDEPVANTPQTEIPDDNTDDPPEKPAGTDGEKADSGKETEKLPEQNVVVPPVNGEESNNPNAPPAQQTQSTADADKRIAELVTKMYVLKSEYTAAVNGIVADMKAEYSLLPKEERNLSAKQSIAARYLGTINTMEAQCDAQVNAIVSELRTLLKANGRDEALADAILSTYATEKENTKAYYLSTYGD